MHPALRKPESDEGGYAMTSAERTDIAIIGGGYYGAFVAHEIKECRPDLEVTILEKEESLFTKASSTNQGQFHIGYMYSSGSLAFYIVRKRESLNQ